jgi:hypothetical protein
VHTLFKQTISDPHGFSRTLVEFTQHSKGQSGNVLAVEVVDVVMVVVDSIVFPED